MHVIREKLFFFESVLTSIVRPARAGQACRFIVEVEDVFSATEAIPKCHRRVGNSNAELSNDWIVQRVYMKHYHIDGTLSH